MKLIHFLAAFLAVAVPTTTYAGPLFFLPDHEPNGWRDTGCDELANVEIKSADGTVLYLNNPTCPNAQGGGDPDHPAFAKPPVEEEDDEEVVEAPVEDEEVIASK